MIKQVAQACLLASIGLAAVNAQAGGQPLAVLPAETVNVEASSAALGDTLLRRLRQTRAFEIVHPETVAKVARTDDCVGQPACLQKLGRSLEVKSLLQLRVGGLGGTHVVRLTLFDASTGTRTGSWQEVLTSLQPATLAPALDRMIAGFAPRPVDQPSRPWYGRWWVWTAVGGVAAAAVATAVVFATQSTPSDADVIIRPP